MKNTFLSHTKLSKPFWPNSYCFIQILFDILNTLIKRSRSFISTISYK